MGFGPREVAAPSPSDAGPTSSETESKRRQAGVGYATHLRKLGWFDGPGDCCDEVDGGGGCFSPGAVAAPAAGVGCFMSPSPITLLGAVPESVAPPPVVETEISRSAMAPLGRGESAMALIAMAMAMKRLCPSSGCRAHVDARALLDPGRNVL